MKHLPVIFLTLIAALACGNLENKPTNTPQTAPAAEAIKISAADLVKAYKANEIAADEKYRGKPLEVAGKVEEISDTFGSLQLDLAGDGAAVSVKCTIGDDQKPQLAKLKKGQSVTLAGTGDGMTAGLYVGLQNCRIK